jgi:NADH-quinone oxidoreductase subunit E
MAVRRLAETQPESFAFTPDNLAWAEREIAKFPEGRQASAVILLLWRAQEQEGWVTKPAIEYVAKILSMPTIRVLEVATFYTMFHLEPVGSKAHVQVCGTTPCMLAGSDAIFEVCRRRIHPEPHHVSADGAFSWEEVECLGACVNAPMVQIVPDTYEDLTPESFEALLDAFERGETPKPGPQDGRYYSMPANGLTTLTEIDYAADDVPPGGAVRIKEHAPSVKDHGAEVAEDEPQMAVDESAGGEPLEAEQMRRAGKAPDRGGGSDPAGAETANQQVGRADPSGRSDEAAARAMGAREEGASDDAPSKAGDEPGSDKSKPAGLAEPRGGEPDDLKRILGVGPVNEKRLHDLGVFHFDQIAAWTPAEAGWVDEQLSFHGRIEREDWIGQAKKLAAGEGEGS